MIELRWITRIIVGSEIDPADESGGDVLQYRVSAGENWGPWRDVPHATKVERVSAYDGRKLSEGQDGNGRQAASPTPTCEVTLFICGPSQKCEHSYDREEPITNVAGEQVGMTKVCSKCGRSAFEDAQWL